MESTQEFRALLDNQEYDFRFQCGICEPAASVTLEDKQRIVEAFCLHYCVFSTVAELEQLKQGFLPQKYSTSMEKHPNAVFKIAWACYQRRIEGNAIFFHLPCIICIIITLFV